MSYLLFMMVVLGVSITLFMAGIVVSREKVVTGLAMHPDPQKSMRNAFSDSIFWGTIFFVSFATEFVLLDCTSV